MKLGCPKWVQVLGCMWAHALNGVYHVAPQGNLVGAFKRLHSYLSESDPCMERSLTLSPGFSRDLSRASNSTGFRDVYGRGFKGGCLSCAFNLPTCLRL